MSVPPTPPPLPEVFKTPPSQLPRNRRTEKAHQREVWWQITFPLLMGLVILIGLAGVIIWGTYVVPGGVNTHVWANISLIFVLLQVMAVILPLLILFGALAYGIMYLHKLLPPYFKVAQDYSELATHKTEWALQYAVKPVLQVRAVIAALDRFIQNVRRFFGR